MVSMKKQKVSCSTPEHRGDSPSRDSDSMCDSDASSPVPFLCTQDGAEGETDVVWNFYTPKSKHAEKSRFKNSTPVSRRSKRIEKNKVVEIQLPKRRALKLPQKKTALFQELIELNQNLHELIAKPQIKCPEKVNSGSEDDIFNESLEYSPKSRMRSNSLCLRRNVLSSNFVKNDPDVALDSDDSMNECLIKASQIVEDNIKIETTAKSTLYEPKFNNRILNPDFNFQMNHDSMDAILNSIKFESPAVNTHNTKKCESPNLNNDSFDSFVGNLNDSVLDKISQMPTKIAISQTAHNEIASKDCSSWSVKELVVHDSSPTTKSIFGRHNSMPESPTIINVNKPSTSGMVFGRYNSMPFGKDRQIKTEPGDSPIKCTPEEIKKKRQLAREKLMAKRLLHTFTSSQKSTQTIPTTQTATKSQQLINPKANNELSSLPKKEEAIVTKKFQPRVPTTATIIQNRSNNNDQLQPNGNSIDIKSIIEKKRQEALMKLRRRHLQSK